MTTPGSLAGERIGPWLLVALVGSGGRAEVYRAHRIDGGFQQWAAIKILHPGVPLSEAENEREQLLELQDCDAAPRVLPSPGPTVRGRGYVVMEYIEGIPADRYADEQGLTAEQRLDLFIQICHALAEVHRRGVLHLDLQPRNVLVEQRTGKVKLVDFGQALMNSADPLIAESAGPLTLDYCSPEQVSEGP